MLREEEIGIDKLDAVIFFDVFDDVEVVKSEGSNSKTGIIPELGDFWSDKRPLDGNSFDSGLFSKSKDVFWGPIRVLIKSIDNRFPGVDFHDIVEHFWVVDLDDEAVKHGGIFGLSISDDFREFLSDAGLVEVFGIGNEVSVRMRDHEVDEGFIIKSMELFIKESREEDIGCHGDVLRKGDMVNPFVITVNKDEVAIFGEVKISFEKTLTEIII